VALSSGTPATPGADEPAPIEAPLAETPAPAAREAYRILVAEDSFLLLATLEAVLDHLGWTLVGPATRKAQALELARSETFDAALLDVNLDGEMSWEVAAVLTERGVPYIFSTGYDMMTVLPPSLAGAVVVTKPYKLDELERRLRSLITESRSRRNARAAE
jgi:DNA-binding response OmpR family regulator